jgi:hypothetical protein
MFRWTNPCNQKQMTTTTISPIIEKVQKLLRLSKSAANANEAAAAAGAANKLIDAYRLSTADLEYESQVVEPIEEDEGFIYESGKVTLWRHNLVNILAAHYGCACWNNATRASGRQVSRYRLVGRKSDIAICKYMFAYITTECSRLSLLEVKGMGRVYISSYCEGFVAGVAVQLKSSRDEAQMNATETSIVKVNARAAESEAFMDILHNTLKAGKSFGGHLNNQAFSQGQRRGENIHLGRAIGATTSKLLIG